MKVPVIGASSSYSWKEPEDLTEDEFIRVYAFFRLCERDAVSQHNRQTFISPGGRRLCCIAIGKLINAEAERRGYKP